MEEIISKKQLDKLASIEGKVRGIGLRDGLVFIQKEEGEEGLRKIEEAMEDLGHPVSLESVNMTKFYSLRVVVILFVAAQEIFNWEDEKFNEMGEFSSTTSSIIRIFMKYLVSLERVVEKAQSMWNTYFSIGEIEIIEFDKEGKKIVMHLKKFNLHPLHCQYLKGYLSKMFGIILKTSAYVEETKCVHQGDDFHEFVLGW